MRDVRDAMMVARNTEGKLIERPLSPHLQVYRWPISMALSISHRATGIVLSVGALFMTWWLVAAATSDHTFGTVQGFLASGFGVFVLLGWSAALLYHLFTGIRHLIWDAGYGFDDWLHLGKAMPAYRVTGWTVVVLTVVATLIVWIIGFVVW